MTVRYGQIALLQWCEWNIN